MRYIIVLGQSLMRDAATGEFKAPPTLQSRVSTGAALFKELAAKDGGGVPVLVLVSGADCVGMGRTEAQCMEELLVKEHVPAAAIWRDDAARNTVENAKNTLAHVLAVAASLGQTGAGSVEVHLITSDFHICRSTYNFSCTLAHCFPGDVAKVRMSSHGSPDCLPPRSSATDLPLGSTAWPDVNLMPRLNRLHHELGLTAAGGKQDQHFRAYGVPPNEELRAVAIAGIRARIANEEQQQ
jgi:hypothetical protein